MELKLSPRQQECLAEICSVMRSVVYAANVNRPYSAEGLQERLFDIVERFQLSPQDFDVLYDKLHRSGANS